MYKEYNELTEEEKEQVKILMEKQNEINAMLDVEIWVYEEDFYQTVQELFKR